MTTRSLARLACGGALVVSVAASAASPAADAAAAPTVDAGQQGFHLEGRPAIDDVFGDATDFQRIIDRFLELSTQMSAMRDTFAKTVQDTLTALGVRAIKPVPGRHGCPIEAVAPSYAKGYRLGSDYLRLGRELTRHYEQVREYDRLGETIGLTPDYRVKVRRVLAQYKALVTDYREMKVAFHDQLLDELRYQGCDLWTLLQRGDPKLATQKVADEWPQPGSAQAPGGIRPPTEATSELPPLNLPVERVPSPSPITLPKTTTPQQPRSGILFYVDNTKCKRPSAVTLDGKRLGAVAGGTRAGFQSQAGPHDLCLLDDDTRKCGEAGTVRRSYLHEGWTITLRCD
ncbi:MAG: hypothetical protein ABI321_12180 [Polyangia bacterium]